MPIEYTQARTQIKNDSRCCGPIAVSIVCDISPLRAQNAMAKQGRRRNQGSQTYQILAAVRAQGFEVRELTKHSITENKTVRSLAKNAPKRGTFLVFVSGHVLAVKDGKVQDWSANRLKRITSIYRVEK